MNFNQSKENSEKNLQTIINKCWEDEVFKQELISNPAQVIEKLFGNSLGIKGKNLVVVDQTDSSSVYINIPVNPENMELTDTELEAVAGGFQYFGTWLCGPDLIIR